jgi:hypothetical protein
MDLWRQSGMSAEKNKSSTIRVLLSCYIACRLFNDWSPWLGPIREGEGFLHYISHVALYHKDTEHW